MSPILAVERVVTPLGWDTATDSCRLCLAVACVGDIPIAVQRPRARWSNHWQTPGCMPNG